MTRKNLTALIILTLGIIGMVQGHHTEGALICIIAAQYAE